MRRRQLLPLAALGCGLAPRAWALDTVPVVAADTPPFAHRDFRGELRGAAIDAMGMAAQRLGLPWRPELEPAARAMLRLSQPHPVLVLAPPRTAAHEKRFQWVHPLIDIELFLWSRRGEQHRAQGGALSGLEVGVLRGTAIHDMAKNLGVRAISTFATQEIGLRMLLSGRFDLLLASEPMVVQALRQLGQPLDEALPSLRMGVVPLYLAASMATPAEVVRAWRGTLAALLQEGEIARNHARYGLQAPAALPASG